MAANANLGSATPVASSTATHTLATWRQACAWVGAQLAGTRSDPFAQDLVIVPTASHQRSLSQFLASVEGAGVCAGVDFVTIDRLRHKLDEQLLGIDADLNPWQPRTLALHVLAAMDASQDQEWFQPIQLHLKAGCDGEQDNRAADRPGRRLVTARHIAHLFTDYLREGQNMVLAWNDGDDVDSDGASLPGHQLWQPMLWRAVRAQIGAADPLARHSQLVELLANQRPQLATGRLCGVMLSQSRPLDGQLLSVLQAHCGLQLVELGLPQAHSSGSVLVRRYASARAVMASEQHPNTVAATTLQQVQADVRANRSASGLYAADGSFQIHASHGHDRQVEVLRDVLTGLFEDDPTLQPREVVVLSPALEVYAPHIAARFGARRDVAHPGQQLRAQLAASSILTENPVLAALRTLLEFTRRRALADELLDFLAQPPVARRFEFSEDDLETLDELFYATHASWGIDGAHRDEVLRLKPNQPQTSKQHLGTWWNAIERMLAGFAFDAHATAVVAPNVAETDEASSPERRALAPLRVVSSDELGLVGRLAEAVARIRMHLYSFRSRATAQQWAARLREAVTDLTDAQAQDAWQISAALAALNSLEAAAADLDTQLGVGDILAIFDDLTPRVRRRPNFGNGTLLFAQLGDLQAVEHRVVVVLGVGDDIFPARHTRSGDDLLAGRSSDRLRLNSRLQLLDALLASTDKFVVVTQGANERTNALIAAPVAVLDLLSSVGVADPQQVWEKPDGSVLRRHALQAQGWSNFLESPQTDQPFSFDAQALQGAIALAEGPKRDPKAGHPWAWQFPERPSADHVSCDQLLAFFKNPASELLNSVGLRLKTYQHPLETQLPIGLDGLGLYQIKNDLVEAMLAGASKDEAAHLVEFGGRVLQGKVGENVVAHQLTLAESIAQRVQQLRSGQPRDVDCIVDLATRNGPVRLTSRVRLWDGQVVAYSAASKKGHDLLRVWLDLLFLAAQGAPSDTRGNFVAGVGSTQLRAPTQREALTMLTQMAELRATGLRQLVVLPCQSAYRGRDCGNRSSSDAASYAWVGSRRRKDGECHDPSWRYFFPDENEMMGVLPAAQDPQPPLALKNSKSRFMRLAGWLFDPILAHEVKQS